MLDSNMAVMLDAFLDNTQGFMEALKNRLRDPKEFMKFTSRMGFGPFVPGDRVLCRSVTYHYVGQIVSVDDYGILLQHAFWINSSGPWQEALASGNLSSIETYPVNQRFVYLQKAAIVETCPWIHPLPDEATAPDLFDWIKQQEPARKNWLANMKNKLGL